MNSGFIHSYKDPDSPSGPGHTEHVGTSPVTRTFLFCAHEYYLSLIEGSARWYSLRRIMVADRRRKTAGVLFYD